MRQNRLIQLLSDNRRPYRPMAQRIAQAAGESEATVYLYDAIVGDRLTAEWWGGVCPQDFAPALRAIDADTIHLRINSPGGDVFGAEAICQALREHRAHVVAHIEGLAASAATAVACACDEVRITANSKYMVHETWSFGMGNKRDMRALADVLEKCDETLYAEYARFSGNDMLTIAAWCEAETWFTGEEAVRHGFAHQLATADATTAQASAHWRLAAYQHAPSDVPTSITPPPSANDDSAAAADAAKRARQCQQLRVLNTRHPIE